MRTKEIAKHLFESAKGYGMTEREILHVIANIDHEVLEDFIYTMYRIADKSGAEGFDV